uniref:Transcription factor n=1 Tax=Geobacter metallireducens TaxID=28232 RepID=A0A831XM16_GEOME
MRRSTKKHFLLLAALTGASLAMPEPAMTALLDMGPVITQELDSTPPKHGFPLWYRDTNRVPLELCLSKAASANGPMCLTAEPNPGAPFSFPDNLGDEVFWWVADASFDIPQQGALDRAGRAILVQAIEGAFSTGDVAPGAQVSFARIRIRIDTPYAGEYVVTTPFKQFTFTVAADALEDGINFTEDLGIAEGGIFSGALGGSIGPFLYCTNAPIVVGTEKFIGDPNVTCAVQGSTFPSAQNPSNFFRVQGPNGFDMQTDQFTVMGKIHEGVIPTPLTVDKASYIRNTAGVQVNVFATTQALSNQTNQGAAFPANFALTGAPSALQVTGTGIPTKEMATNSPADGKFFSASGIFAAPEILPATVTVTNTADTPVTSKEVPLVDEVTVSQATYRPLSKTLTIAAASSDAVANPALQAFIPGMTDPVGTFTNGNLAISFPVLDNSVIPAKTYGIPPASITVKSAAGGETTVPVTVAEVTDLPPTGSVVINGGAATTGSATVTLTLSASDDSGSVAQMSFSKDGVYFFPYETYATTRQVSLVNGPGANTIYVRFRDAAGNVSPIYSDNIILDTTPPAGTVVINGGATYATSITAALALSATDDNGTVTGMRFSKDGVYFFPFETYATSRQVTLDGGDGVKTIYARYQDAAGNISPIVSDTIILDTVAPTGTIVINGGATTTNTTAATLTLSAADANGVTHMQFSKDNITWTPFEPYATTRNVTLLPGEGFKTMYVRYRDTAGNVSVPYGAVIILDLP